ncbi:M20/M25/M40 family metallo-hydrolase [Dokdonella soli]|uniref:M20/M25/M40 family metallo-hydrolase n=1 Tax=Dokdonella soli TaxID=529810 RepID=A0ABN1IDG6_9GAMM
MKHAGVGTWVFSMLLASLAPAAQSQSPAPDEATFRALYKQLVEINTTLSVGSCTEAAKAMQARLIAGGIPAADTQILVPPGRPKDGNLIATYKGSDRKAEPILLLAHIDVVEAKRADWIRDPFKLVEEGGWFYARGASDDKAMAAVFTDSLIRYHKEGFKPRRDIRLALTCGEETSDTFDGVSWLLKEHPALLKAAFALNEGAGGELDQHGKPVALQIQAGEKVYQDFRLETTDVGGHSSRPTKKNPIYELSTGLAKIGAYQFPISLNEATRAYFKAQIELAPPAVAEDIKAVLRDPPDAAAADRLWAINPGWNSMLRTTCVATMVDAGHAPNALPQHAGANVNCRILPGVPLDAVRNTLAHVMGDDKVTIKAVGEPSPVGNVPQLTPAIMDPVRKVAEGIWPGIAIVPTMSTGATDGRFLNAAGTPTYGLSGMFHDAEGSHAHGLNERIRVKSLMDGRRFLYEIVKVYANGEG